MCIWNSAFQHTSWSMWLLPREMMLVGCSSISHAVSLIKSGTCIFMTGGGGDCDICHQENMVTWQCTVVAFDSYFELLLTHWGRVTHICVNKLTIIGSDKGLSPDRRQAIIWTNGGILLIWTLGPKFSEIESEIDTFSSKEMHLKMSSGKWRPFCLGLNVLMSWLLVATE